MVELVHVLMFVAMKHVDFIILVMFGDIMTDGKLYIICVKHKCTAIESLISITVGWRIMSIK